MLAFFTNRWAFLGVRADVGEREREKERERERESHVI